MPAGKILGGFAVLKYFFSLFGFDFCIVLFAVKLRAREPSPAGKVSCPEGTDG